MYWWNIFQKLCGTKEIKNDIQDQLEKDNADTLKQKEILNQPENDV